MELGGISMNKKFSSSDLVAAVLIGFSFACLTINLGKIAAITANGTYGSAGIGKVQFGSPIFLAACQLIGILILALYIFFHSVYRDETDSQLSGRDDDGDDDDEYEYVDCEEPCEELDNLANRLANLDKMVTRLALALNIRPESIREDDSCTKSLPASENECSP